MTPKPPLLFLCHRIPYPPNKGDKIRSWHLLKHLAQDFSIHLATFVDDPVDHIHEGTIRALCASALFVPLNPRWARLKSLIAILRGDALSLAYYRHHGMQQWVDATVAEHEIKRALVFCSPMAQYVLPGTPAGASMECRVLDLVDVDSDKWQQYACTQRWPFSWVYAREGRTLLEFERKAMTESQAGFLVSAREAALFHRLAPESEARVSHFNNGVDHSYFAPNPALPNPYAKGTPTLVFTGAMDYWPNVDAVCWFVHEVLPVVRKRCPEVALCIVGGKPSPAVQALGELPGVTVTGRVADVRPYLQHSFAAIAPLRIARGIQNKVLEGMAMARPVLVSPMGLEGIEATHGDTVLLCETAEDYAIAVVKLLAAKKPSSEAMGILLGRRARALIERDFNWAQTLAPVRVALGAKETKPQAPLSAQVDQDAKSAQDYQSSRPGKGAHRASAI